MIDSLVPLSTLYQLLGGGVLAGLGLYYALSLLRLAFSSVKRFFF